MDTKKSLIVIYGGGGYGHSILSAVKIKYPNCDFIYVDGNPSLRGTNIEGVPVKSPESVLNVKDIVVVIASVQGFKNIRERLIGHFGVSQECIDESFSKNMYERTFGVRQEFLRLFANVCLQERAGRQLCRKGRL